MSQIGVYFNPQIGAPPSDAIERACAADDQGFHSIWMADHLTKTSAPSGGVGPKKMLLSPVFWIMFVMMTMMSTSGLMVISQMATFAKDFGIAAVTIGGMAAVLKSDLISSY